MCFLHPISFFPQRDSTYTRDYDSGIVCTYSNGKGVNFIIQLDQTGIEPVTHESPVHTTELV